MELETRCADGGDHGILARQGSGERLKRGEIGINDAYGGREYGGRAGAAEDGEVESLYDPMPQEEPTVWRGRGP